MIFRRIIKQGDGLIASHALTELVDRKLADKNFFGVHHEAGKKAIAALRQGLLDMPEPALRKFLDADYQVILAPSKRFDEYYRSHGMDVKHRSVNGRHIPKGGDNPFGNQPSILICSDRPPSKIAQTFVHEAGHALDHIQAGFKGYKSLNSPWFKPAAQDYITRQAKEEPTIVQFDGDRSFRGTHFPLYSKNFNKEAARGHFDRSLYLELTAEMFKKFTYISKEHGGQGADRWMAHHYGSAWSVFKEDIVPEVGQAIAAARLTETLGRKNVLRMAFQDSGEILVAVPLGYSRSNFSALGIGNAKGKLSLKNHHDHAVVTIPADVARSADLSTAAIKPRSNLVGRLLGR